MRTDDLIADLAAQVRPVSSSAPTRWLLLGVLLGGAAAVVLMISMLGVRPDIGFALHTPPFWLKASYTLVLAVVGFVLAERAGRPGSSLKAYAGLALLAFALVAAVGLAQMMSAPATLRPALALGGSYKLCPWLIVVVSAPILLGALLTLRRMAPTRPMLAGAAAGLLAGGAGAAIYSLHCTESSAMFLAFWYTLGILGVMGVGALCGRFVLRW